MRHAPSRRRLPGIMLATAVLAVIASNAPAAAARVAVSSELGVSDGAPADASSVQPPPADADPARTFLQSLTPQHGTVELLDGAARLELPDSFYFLSAADTRRVLEEVWGNPPDQSPLGMLFASGTTPLDDGAWGVVITYSEDGHVDDGDAADIDYGAMLKDMQQDVAAANADRASAGFPAVELVGWAAPPRYDAVGRKLFWAKELKFGDTPVNTLNYSIRVLGRKGVLELNFVASMAQLVEIEERAPAVLALASFGDGHGYGDFDPHLDKVAAYGLGALVAGKVAAKLGLLAGGLLLLKKFGVVVIAGTAAAIGWLRKKRSRTG